MDIETMTDEELVDAASDAPIGHEAVEGSDGEGVVIGVPGPIWDIGGGNDAYVVLWAHRPRTRVIVEADEDGTGGYETDYLHIQIPIDRIATLQDALTRAVENVRSRIIK